MIVAVIQVSDTVIGDGRPGWHAQNLMSALRNQIDENLKNKRFKQKEALYVGQ